METQHMFELAHALAVAKSRQDVPAALALMHPEMKLESSFGTRAWGLAENERALTRFFESFPDYEVSLQGHAGVGDVLVCWGVVRMTMTGDRFGVVPNGRRTALPVFIQLSFTQGRISGERFFFDLSDLCAQSGVSTDAVRHRLFGEPLVAAHPDQGRGR